MHKTDSYYIINENYIINIGPRQRYLSFGNNEQGRRNITKLKDLGLPSTPPPCWPHSQPQSTSTTIRYLVILGNGALDTMIQEETMKELAFNTTSNQL